MQNEISLENMTLAEKIRLLERIWEDVCRQPGDVRSPEWHRAILEERAQKLADGSTTVSPWDEAKQRLLDLGK